MPDTATRRLYRSRDQGMIAGVCAGIAEYLDIDPTLVRLVAILTIFAGGAGVVAYLIGWVIIPPNPAQEPTRGFQRAEETKERVVEEIRTAGERVEEEVRSREGQERGRILAGLVLVLLGLIFLLNQLVDWLSWGELWPLVLIAVGVVLLFQARR